ncbi:MAG TPA: protein kinase, partial [Glaciihabitans sp.]|nr:protein kinase [Glaciihabitans sp.]
GQEFASASTPLELGGYSLLRGRYRVISAIGQGGKAAVYRATDQLLGRDVAIKLFDAPSKREQDVARQQNELNALASLNHHSLVSLLDAGIENVTDPTNPELDESRMYLVMELITGPTLKTLISKKRLSRRQIATIGMDLAEGLEYMHQMGVIHRDIKPSNILMVQYTAHDRRMRAKLADFGIALMTDKARWSEDGPTVGTAAYLSPEQARGEPIGPPSDVYSLGLVLLECFTREMAFQGTLVQSAVARLLRDPAIPDDLPPGWRNLLTSMTARSPDERPSIDEVITFLQQAMLSESARHRGEATPALPDEAARIEAVRRYRILDTPPDGAFDRITALAARILEVPIAIVSIVDSDRIWFKSHHGLDVDTIGRDPGLCASAIMQNNAWVVENATVDPRTLANPLVAGELGINFYAGIPLHTRDGHNLGTLCVLDFVPRTISPSELATLEDLAAMVMSELEVRLATRRASGLSDTDTTPVLPAAVPPAAMLPAAVPAMTIVTAGVTSDASPGRAAKPRPRSRWKRK